jgi:hypothetical protein
MSIQCHLKVVVLVFAAFNILVACKFYPEQPKGKPVDRVYTAPAAAKPAATQSLSSREKMLARMLAEADYALSQDRLLTPIEDNAFDRFHSVLLMDPNNKSAKTGLQTIALRYIEMARNSIARGQYAQAQNHINNARGIDPQSPLLDETTAYLRRERAAQPPVQAYKPGPNEHLLNAQELSRKSPVIVAQLAQLAQKAQESGDLVMIYARNDAEGRWIYAQMRDSLEDFLLRGDIKIAPQPRVQFVPVL